MKNQNVDIHSHYHRKFYDQLWIQSRDMKVYGPTSRHVRRLIKNTIADLDFHSVLDIGCGEGSLLREIANWRRSSELSGIDVSEKAIEIAGSRVKGEFQILDVQNESLDRKFDLVICSEVLEHLENDVQALSNIYKMASKYLVVIVPLEQGADVSKDVGHVQSYTRGEFLKKMQQARFKILSARKWGFPFYSPLYRWFLRRAPKSVASGEFGLFRKLVSYLLYQLFALNFGDWGGKLIVLAVSESSEGDE